MIGGHWPERVERGLATPECYRVAAQKIASALAEHEYICAEIAQKTPGAPLREYRAKFRADALRAAQALILCYRAIELTPGAALLDWAHRERLL